MSKRTYGWALLLLFAAGLAVRVSGLGRESLWLDEIIQAKGTSLPTFRAVFDYNVQYFPDHSPANNLLLHAVGLGPASSEFAWRAPSALMGAATVPLIGLLAGELFGPVIGLVSALVLALAPFHVAKASQEVGDYGQLVLLCVAGALVFVHAVRHGRMWRWALFGLIVGATLYSHLLAVFYSTWCGCLAAGWWVWGRVRSGKNASDADRTPLPFRRVVGAVTALGLGGLIYAPWFVPFGYRALGYKAGNWLEPNIREMFALVAPVFGKGSLPAALFLGLAAIGALSLLRQRSCWVLFIGGWACLFIPIFVLFWINRTIIRPHYLLSVFPPVCILNAVGAVAVGNMIQRSLRPRSELQVRVSTPGVAAIVSALILVAAESAYGLYRVRTDINKEPWRDMAFSLDRQVTDRDMVVCSPVDPYFCFEYYQGRLEKPLPLWNWDALIALSQVDEARLRSQHGRIWYVVRGGVPKHALVEGTRYREHSVYTWTPETTATADFAALAQELIAMGGTSDLLMGQAASAFYRAGRPEKVIELLEPHAQRRGAGTLPDFWFLLGDAYEAKGQTDKAAEAFLAYAKSQQGGNRMQGEYRAINAYYAGGQTDRALAEGLAALEQYPGFAPLNYLVANCYELKGERDKAYALILENARRHLQDAYAQFCCGAYHLTFGNLDAAEAALRYAIGLDPAHYPRMYAALAQVYGNRQDPGRAEDALREGVQATWDPELVLMLVDALIARNSPAEAAGVLRFGVERNPADTALRDRLRALEQPPAK